jgi:hypothetical protein
MSGIMIRVGWRWVGIKVQVIRISVSVVAVDLATGVAVVAGIAVRVAGRGSSGDDIRMADSSGDRDGAAAEVCCCLGGMG